MSGQGEKSELNPGEGDLSRGQWLLYGMVCFAAAAGLFFWLQSLESSGEGAAVHWLIALAYGIGGKWTVGIVFGALGLLCIFVGITSPGKKK